MAVRLFVGNLPYNTTEAELRELFSAVGPLSYVQIPTDRESGRPRGFAFVEFGDRAQAEEAIRRFNSQMFKGRALAVNEARAREDRPRDSRPPSPARPFTPRPQPFGGPSPDEVMPRGEGPSRNFGPDAPPRRTRAKSNRGTAKGERVPKGPLRERSGGRFFGSDTGEEEQFDEDANGENFASRVDDESEDDL